MNKEENQNWSDLKKLNFWIPIVLTILIFLFPNTNNIILTYIDTFKYSFLFLLLLYFVVNDYFKSRKKIISKPAYLKGVWCYDSYLPGQLKKSGWTLTSLEKIKDIPKIDICDDHHVGFYLRIEAHPNLFIDKNDDELTRNRCKRIEFIYSKATLKDFIRIMIKVKNKTTDQIREVSFIPSTDESRVKPIEKSNDSYWIPVNIKELEGNWKSLEIDLVKVCEEKFVEIQNEEFVGYLHTRLKGSLCIKQIKLYFENSNTSTNINITEQNNSDYPGRNVEIIKEETILFKHEIAFSYFDESPFDYGWEPSPKNHNITYSWYLDESNKEFIELKSKTNHAMDYYKVDPKILSKCKTVEFILQDLKGEKAAFYIGFITASDDETIWLNIKSSKSLGKPKRDIEGKTDEWLIPIKENVIFDGWQSYKIDIEKEFNRSLATDWPLTSIKCFRLRPDMSIRAINLYSNSKDSINWSGEESNINPRVLLYEEFPLKNKQFKRISFRMRANRNDFTFIMAGIRIVPKEAVYPFKNATPKDTIVFHISSSNIRDGYSYALRPYPENDDAKQNGKDYVYIEVLKDQNNILKFKIDGKEIPNYKSIWQDSYKIYWQAWNNVGRNEDFEVLFYDIEVE
jgi:hypothetical protein